MTAYTPNFDLPYPTAPDAPCDFPQQWCDFTNAVTEVLDRFEAIANRTNPSVPIAKMRLTRPVLLTGDSVLAFDAVEVNNAGMIDFDVSRNRIRIQRPGRYSAEAHVMFNASTTANNNYSVTINGVMLDTIRVIDLNTSFVAQVYTTPIDLDIFTFGPLDVSVRVNATLAPSFTVADAALAVYWFADRDAP